MRTQMTINGKTFEVTGDYTFLEDFILTRKDWKLFEPGTKAYRVITYNAGGNVICVEYVLKGMDNTYEVLKEAKIVPIGYYTSTCIVTKK